jgi:hypothetical protein
VPTLEYIGISQVAPGNDRGDPIVIIVPLSSADYWQCAICSAGLREAAEILRDFA